MNTLNLAYGTVQTTQKPFADVVAALKAQLPQHGFGLQCEIDLAKTLREKLGVDGLPYVILGICNPTFAHEALQREPMLGLLLPCNLVVTQTESGTSVGAVDAAALLGVVGNPALQSMAQEVNTHLHAIIDAALA
ncbi:MAG: DUF302 domain-containing protein [Vulcanimicrobiaceae bacterium]|jgi:uncharacterized protein (DUF302 family)